MTITSTYLTLRSSGVTASRAIFRIWRSQVSSQAARSQSNEAEQVQEVAAERLPERLQESEAERFRSNDSEKVVERLKVNPNDFNF